MAFFEKLKTGLAKTRSGLFHRAVPLFTAPVNEETLEELEEILILSDMGPASSAGIISSIRQNHARGAVKDLRMALKQEILARISGSTGLLMVDKPLVIMVVGVNGVGKTTSIGKLAKKFYDEGLQVTVAAGDTFRAAAIEQLEIWAKRTHAHFVKHQGGADPAAVAFDAVVSAQARHSDVVIVDTAGRLHTKSNLMEELKKIHRVLGKAMTHAPHEVLLVLDATTGQNGLQQAKVFHQAIGLTGIILTKLDGSAKGGIVLAIRQELNVPVKLVGVGEAVDDLQEFIPSDFVEALFPEP